DAKTGELTAVVGSVSQNSRGAFFRPQKDQVGKIVVEAETSQSPNGDVIDFAFGTLSGTYVENGGTNPEGQGTDTEGQGNLGLIVGVVAAVLVGGGAVLYFFVVYLRRRGRLEWLGHSAFLVTSSRGTRILLDPPRTGMGYDMAPIRGVDAVLVSHEHSDHNNIELAEGDPVVLRGLSPDGWNAVDQEVKDVRVFSISPASPVYHDDQQGAVRGRNTIFVLEVDGLRIAHLGDLGHVLSQQMVQSIGDLDVLLVPVGGNYTLDAGMATEVVEELRPRAIIPMHYKTSVMREDWPGSGVEPFLEDKRVVRPNRSFIELSSNKLPDRGTVIVLDYKR
ncbi:MAG: MBL fold metallo-hydrolase, partial [Theionarchaea archaeon]|nr:MBL fold metallo-hydrolase [Theionarchaea archaeon]